MAIAIATLEAIREQYPLIFEVLQKLIQDVPDPRALGAIGQKVVASARITPPSPVFFVGGDAAIEYIAPPSPPGAVTLIALPGSTWTLAATAAGNISVAMTPTAGFACTMAYDAVTKRFFPVTGPAAGAGPGGGQFVKIAKVTTVSSQTAIDFSSIPATYTDIEIRYVARSNVANVSEIMRMQFNGDAVAANYTITQILYGNNAAAIAYTSPPTANGVYCSDVTGATAVALCPATGQLRVNGYSQTVFNKVMETYGSITGAAGVAQQFTQVSSGIWTSTAAITSIRLTLPTSFVDGSVFTLYGIG